MTRTPVLLAACFASTLLLAGQCRAASSTSSAASDSASTSVGSVSTSFQRSSDSSSTQGVAQGDYRIVAMTTASGQPGHVRLTLRAIGADGPADDVDLLLPRAAAEQSRLAPGQVVSARQRGYGLAWFAGTGGSDAFFLVLADDVYRELQTRKVTAL